MNKIIILVIIYLAALTPITYSQNAVCIEKPQAINDYELLVQPGWTKKQSFLGKLNDDVIGLPVKKNTQKPPTPIDAVEIEKWVASYNKINNSNYAVNYKSAIQGRWYIITQQRKIFEKKVADDFTPATKFEDLIATEIFTSQYYSNEGKKLLVDRYVRPDGKYKIALYPGINFKEILGFKCQKALTKYNVNTNSLVEGKITVQYFIDSTSTLPDYFYAGDLKNGVPEGYGLFIRINHENGGYLVRCGNWRNGDFVTETVAKQFADSIAVVLLKGKAANNFGYIFNEIVYQKDVLNPSFTNGFSNLYTMFWQDSIKKKHYTKLYFRSDDFFSHPNLNVLEHDSATNAFNYTNVYEKSQDEPSILDFVYKAIVKKFVGFTYYYDDYTKIVEYDGYNCNGRITGTSSTTTYEDRPNMIGGTTMYENTTEEPEYGYDQCKTYDISILKNESTDDWESLGSFSTLKINDGYGRAKFGAGSIMVNSFWDQKFSTAYYSNSDALDAIVSVIQKKYPHPKENVIKKPKKIKSKEELNSDAKIDLLFKRIASSKTYQFTAEDSIAGAWHDAVDHLIYFIEPNNNKWTSISTGSEAINEFKGYQNYLTKIFGVYDGHSITLTQNADGKIDRKELSIDKLFQNSIKFTDGSTWTRIRE